MSTRKSFFINPLAICSVAAFMALAVACGDDDDSNETPNSGNKSAGGEKTNDEGGESNGGKSGSGTSGSAGTAGSGGTAGSSAEGGAGGAPEGDCTDEADKGCFSCKPTKLLEFLNACPTTGSTSFDNEKLTSLGKDGKLPELP